MDCLRPKIQLRHFLILFATASVGFAPSARAALGDDASAVAAAGARLKVSVRITSASGYVVHEMALPVGTTMRQFVGKSGKVFAVTWSGLRHPDMRDVLGDHYDQYKAAVQARGVARRMVRLELLGIVVELGSYLRSFWGHAYLTDLAPPDWPAGLARGAR